jgi:hypothetical protein
MLFFSQIILRQSHQTVSHYLSRVIWGSPWTCVGKSGAWNKAQLLGISGGFLLGLFPRHETLTVVIYAFASCTCVMESFPPNLTKSNEFMHQQLQSTEFFRYRKLKHKAT